MSELLGFPMVSQLDGDKNEQFDCVPASIAAGLEYLTKRTYTAREVKDAVYGAGYVGGTAARAYVDYVAAAGVKLYPLDGLSPALVSGTLQALTNGHPVLFTEPDPYDKSGNWTHVVIAYKADAGSITVMDPYIKSPVTKSLDEWTRELDFNEVWIMASNLGVPPGWKDDGTTLTSPQGVPVKMGFREKVLNTPWDPANVPLSAEYGVSLVQLHNPALGPGDIQVFRDCWLWWTKDKGVVLEPFSGLEYAACLAKIAVLQSALDTQKNTPPPGPGPNVQAVVKQAIGLLEPLAAAS